MPTDHNKPQTINDDDLLPTRAQRISKLAEAIIHHKRLYYSGAPEISDAAYDQLEHDLSILAPAHPALTEVGSIQESDLPKIKHIVPMLSLAKTYSFDELTKWIDSHPIVGSFKIDGNSLSLEYNKGQLTQSKTRGNGYLGENVSSKIKWVSDCMQTVDASKWADTSLDIRGELFCDAEQFVHLSTEMLALGLERPTNPRNIVAGILGRKQHVELARYFGFYAFDVLPADGRTLFTTESEKLAWLADQGFRLPDWQRLVSVNDVQKFLAKTRAYLDDGQIGIDGAVFTYDDLSLHEQLGATAHHPRFRMSFKWQGQTAQTIIKKLEWSTSRLGIVTPVAIVEAVSLSGASITNVTLHNAAHVISHNLKIGDCIEIVRSGEVIPKFLQVIKAKPGRYQVPDKCPSCAQDLKFDQIRLVCSNSSSCPAQHLGGLLNWIRCAEIDDLSEKRLLPLIERGMVKQAADLYTLTNEQLLTLPLTKEKMAQKLLANIAASKKLPLSSFLSGLGIQGAGITTWIALVDTFGSLAKIRAAKVEQLLDIHGFADKLAKQIVDGLISKAEEIDQLLEVGVTPTNIASNTKKSGALSGKAFVLTGTMSLPREQIAALIRDHGGKISSAVSKNTYALVIADTDSQSSKAKNARKLKVPLISEYELQKMLILE